MPEFLPSDQPIRAAMAPDESDSTLVGSWLVPGKTAGGADYSSAGNDATVSSQPRWEYRGAYFDGTDDKLDCGNVGSIAQVDFWINPVTTTQEILQIDANKHITLAAGTVTYTGLTASATYVNGAAGTTVAADEWSHVVCQFTADSAANFEIGNEGANFGNINIASVCAWSAAQTAAQVATRYAAAVPDDGLVLWYPFGDRDYSRYGRALVGVNGPILGRRMEFAAASSQYLREAVANWRSGDSAGTIVAWIKPGTLGAYQTVFASADEATATKYVFCGITPTGYLFVSQRNAGTQDLINATTTATVADVWYRAVWVSSGTGYSFYLNGAAQAIAGGSGTDSGDWFADTDDRDNAVIGCFRTNTALYYWGGSLFDVRVYSRAWSAAEAAIDYAQTEMFL